MVCSPFFGTPVDLTVVIVVALNHSADGGTHTVRTVFPERWHVHHKCRSTMMKDTNTGIVRLRDKSTCATLSQSFTETALLVFDQSTLTDTQNRLTLCSVPLVLRFLSRIQNKYIVDLPAHLLLNLFIIHTRLLINPAS